MSSSRELKTSDPCPLTFHAQTVTNELRDNKRAGFAGSAVTRKRLSNRTIFSTRKDGVVREWDGKVAKTLLVDGHLIAISWDNAHSTTL